MLHSFGHFSRLSFVIFNSCRGFFFVVMAITLIFFLFFLLLILFLDLSYLFCLFYPSFCDLYLFYYLSYHHPLIVTIQDFEILCCIFLWSMIPTSMLFSTFLLTFTFTSSFRSLMSIVMAVSSDFSFFSSISIMLNFISASDLLFSLAMVSCVFFVIPLSVFLLLYLFGYHLYLLLVSLEANPFWFCPFQNQLWLSCHQPFYHHLYHKQL